MKIAKPIMAAIAVATSLALVGPVSDVSAAPQRPEPCSPPPKPQPDPKPTTVDTVGQAYYCLLANYYSGPVIDSRDLLLPAFAALTQELHRRKLDQPNAVMPALKGKKHGDWSAFKGTLERIVEKLPEDAAQAALKAALNAMVESLHDNHANWRQPPPKGEKPKLFGFRTSGFQGPGHVDVAGKAPLFINHVLPDGSGDKAGIKVGDEILSIDGVPPYVDGVPLLNVIMELRHGTKQALTLELRRPSTGDKFTRKVTKDPVPSNPAPQFEARLVDGDVAYVQLPGFFPDVADKVLAAIEKLREGKKLRGIVLDLRENGGGSPKEVKRLLTAWAHNKIISYLCTVEDRCTPTRTDDSVELLNLPLVALTDRGCASACDAFVSAVKDLRLGTLVGTRTAGAVAGPAKPWILNDSSLLVLPDRHEISANKQLINTVGVAPDHFVALTSEDMSKGRDPGLDKALSLLR